MIISIFTQFARKNLQKGPPFCDFYESFCQLFFASISICEQCPLRIRRNSLLLNCSLKRTKVTLILCVGFAGIEAETQEFHQKQRYWVGLDDCEKPVQPKVVKERINRGNLFIN